MTRAPSRGGGQRGEQAGGAGADDDEVERSGVHADAVRYRRGLPLWLRHDASLAHDIPGHPGAPGADPRARGGAGAPRLVRLRRVRRGAGGRARAAAGRAPEPHVAFIEELCAARRRRRSTSTRRRCPSTWEAALRAAGGAVALVDALLGGEAPAGFSALRPPGHHAEPRARDGLLLLQQRRGRGARTRAPRTGVERVLILDWDVHHGNGTQRHLPRRRRRAVRLDPPVAAVSGHGPARDVGLGRGGGLHGQPAGAGGHGRRRPTRSLVEHVVAPLIARLRAAARAGLGGLRRPPRRPAGALPGHRGGLRGDDARRCGGAARRVGAPLGLVLEGGYDRRARWPGSVAALLPVLGGRTPRRRTPAPSSGTRWPPTRRARLAPWWPGAQRGVTVGVAVGLAGRGAFGTTWRT